MDKEKLREKVEAAKHAVKDLDPELKETAFRTILEKLLQEEDKKVPRKGKTIKKTKSVSSGNTESDEISKKLFSELNRADYAEMEELRVTLDRALYLLMIARDKAGIDGLTPPQISKILTDKFRLKATASAVSMALMDANKYVDRRPTVVNGATAYKYCIMREGEKRITEKLSEVKKNE